MKNIKRQLIDINPIFKHIFDMGSKYNYIIPRKASTEFKKLIFKYNYSNIDFDFVGKLYQFYISKGERKEYGQFYTPESIIDEILDSIDYCISNNRIINSKIMDPACGSGSFLVRTTSRLKKTCTQNGLDPESTLQLICNNIYGFDIKEFAIYLSTTNILVQLLSSIKHNNNVDIKLNLYITDTLFNLTESAGCIEETEITNIKRRKGKYVEGFDYIIGNPPYFKVKCLDDIQKKYFEQILIGQQNIYSLFLYFSINMLKNNGKLGMIIPESIKSGSYFQGIRNAIMESCRITHIVSFDCRKTNFYDALQGVMILCLSREQCDGEMPYQIRIKNVNNEDNLMQNRFNNCINVKYKDVVREINNYNFLLICKRLEDYNIINKLYENCNLLNDDNSGYKVSTGKLVWNQNKKYLKSIYKQDCKKLIWSTNIESYKINLNGNKKGEYKYIEYVDDLKNKSNIGELLLIKRTSTKEQANRVAVCLFSDDEEYYIENHINYIVKKSETEVSYKYLLALLNSSLLNYIASQIMCNTQLSVTELNLLPIKYGFLKEIEQLVSTIMIESDESVKNELKQRINRYIYNIYLLDDTEIDLISY
jgi:type I restriction-modification system DNA methylase subunit